MPIRIVHTADNHLDLPFRQYPAEVASRLIEERFLALGRLVAVANERNAHFFVVAGDLFDSTRVKVGGFAGRPRPTPASTCSWIRP